MKLANKFFFHLFLLLATLICFLLLYFINFLPVKEHKKKNTYILELYFFINNQCYHIHHWITLSVILIIIFLINIIDNIIILNIIIGLILGAILEDFLFKDEFKLKNNCFKHSFSNK